MIKISLLLYPHFLKIFEIIQLIFLREFSELYFSAIQVIDIIAQNAILAIIIGILKYGQKRPGCNWCSYFQSTGSGLRVMIMDDLYYGAKLIKEVHPRFNRPMMKAVPVASSTGTVYRSGWVR